MSDPVATSPNDDAGTQAAIVHVVPTVPRNRPVDVTPVAWDPFQLMDRLDEDLIRKELEGIASTELVYVVKEGNQEVVGLSKTGVDECCMMLVAQGQVIREEDLVYEILGNGDDREAIFKVRAARYAVAPDGTEVRLDQVIGVKRQPLYYEQVPLSLDAKVPGKKYRGRTYRELLTDDEGRDYLGWMCENFSDQTIRDFVRRILDGEDVGEVKAGRKLNPHWYEHGAMKAARNARYRLIPANVRGQIIARARQSGQVRHVGGDTEPNRAGPWKQGLRDATGQQEINRVPRPTLHREEGGPGAPGSRVPEEAGQSNGGQSTGGVNSPHAGSASSPYAPSEKQVAFFKRLADSPVFTEEERERALEWLATRATRQTIKDQIDWLKGQVEKRRAEG